MTHKIKLLVKHKMLLPCYLLIDCTRQQIFNFFVLPSYKSNFLRPWTEKTSTVKNFLKKDGFYDQQGHFSEFFHVPRKHLTFLHIVTNKSTLLLPLYDVEKCAKQFCIS